MTKHTPNINAQQLLAALKKAKMIQPSACTKMGHFIQTKHQHKELPLYVSVLVGIGALISSAFFIHSLASILDFATHPIFWGLVCVGSALLLTKMSAKDKNTVSHSFLITTSFCAMLMGKPLCVIGLADMIRFDGVWEYPLATLIITAATYHVYPLSIDRFVWTVAIFILLFIAIHIKRPPSILIETIRNLSVLTQVIMAFVLLTHPKVKRDYRPMAYAAAFSLCITVTYIEKNLTFVNTILTMSLMGLMGWAASTMKKLKTAPFMVASLGAVLLGVIGAPGMILAICLMILGHAKHDKLLLFMGGIIMPLFLFRYYDDLDMTLLEKSGMLVANGLLFLAGRGYMAVKKLDRETP